MIYAGTAEIKQLYIGTREVTAVYAGTTKIYPKDNKAVIFSDDFNRSSPDPIWTGSGGIIENGALKKNGTAGTATYTTVEGFEVDDFDIVATLGSCDDDEQRGGIKYGDSSRFIRIEFGQIYGNISDSNGLSVSFPRQPWAGGDVIRFQKIGSTILVSRNNVMIAQTTSGVTFVEPRHISLSVAMGTLFFTKYYGPTFTDIRLSA